MKYSKTKIFKSIAISLDFLQRAKGRTVKVGGAKLFLLPLVLALTSCSTSAKVEQQARLIEYENCLDTYRDLLIENMKRFPPSTNELSEQRIEASQTYSMKKCQKYRP